MSVESVPTSPSSESFKIRPVTKEDVEPILVFLRKFFFKDEPLNVSVQLISEENPVCPEIEAFSINSIDQDISVIAVTESEQIIGVCLNGILKKDHPKEADSNTNSKFSKIMRLLSFLDKEADVFGMFPDVDKVITINVLSVDSELRGKGIAKKLIDKTREIAREQGCGIMRVDCSSHFTAKAMARLGFECVYTLKYEDYLEDGEVVFKTSPPHKEATVYIQRLNNSQV